VERRDEVWKTRSLVKLFLEGIRAAVPLAAEQIDVMLRLIAARRQPVTRFADIGCGSGVLARAILSRYPQAQGVLVDFSEPMIEAARAQLAGHTPCPHFVVADLALPEWTDAIAPHGPFDAIVSGYAIHHLPDERKRALYGEVFALLAPGGMFANVEHVASLTPWIEAISDDLFVDSLYAFHRQREPSQSREQVAHEFAHRPDKAANILAPVEVQCDWLRAWGFADVDCYFKVLELAVFGGRRP
jgi:tRNA (cmo5U34)-methyltransferase